MGFSRTKTALERADRWRDARPRPLCEAARLARRMAEAEGWPIARTPAGRTDAWYRAAMLKMLEIKGVHASTRLAQSLSPSARGLKLSEDADFLCGMAEPGPIWRDLSVARKEFDRFLDYLRSFY